jgi:hypothetical protein
VLTRRDLLALGFTEKGVRHRIQTGRLHAVHRGVYAVGRRELGREGRWMAAVRACGSGACLSHRSAAALWGFANEHPDYVDVSVRRRCRHRRAGLKVRSRPFLPAEDVTTLLGIPLTQPVRTLIDFATTTGPRTLERAVNEADKHDVVDPERLRRELERYPGDPGVRPLRTLLDKHTFLLSDDELEVLFRPIAAAAGLPTPRTKVVLNRFEVDFFWPDLGLVVETDGWRYHRTPSAQTRDALRFQLHTASGLTPLRFSHYQVKYEPRHVRQILERTAGNLCR